MKTNRYITLSGLIVLLFLPLAAQAQTCQKPFNVGYKVVTVPGGPMTAIWYPTSTAEKNYKYADDFSSTLAENGAPETCRKFPLIVFSHGMAGCGSQSLFLTETMARMGYVVAAPDHADAGLCKINDKSPVRAQENMPSFLEPQKWSAKTGISRRRDIKQVLDWMLGPSEWSAAIDHNKVGGMGHSTGGYTILGMMGGWSGWQDGRIDAGLLLSPYVHPFMNGDLSRIKKPIMYQGAQFDLGITPALKGKKGAYAMGSMPSYLVELRGGSHFEWTNLLCGGTGSVENCLRKKPNARLMTWYGIGFFDAYLKNDFRTLRQLDGKGVATYEKK